MSSWKGKTKGGASGYMFFVPILKYAGLSTGYFFIRFFSVYFLLFAPTSFKNMYAFYHKALRFNLMKSVRYIYRNYFTFGQILLDKTAMMAGFKTKLTFDFEGEEYLQKMIEEKTGGFLISAHIGNFEMAGHLLKRLNARINIVMYDAEHEKIKRYLAGILENSNVNFIRIKDDMSHIYELREAIVNKEIICIHGDRFVDKTNVMSMDFLENKALFPTGPFILPVRYRVPVSFVFAMKESKKHYHFYATPGKVFKQGAIRHHNETSVEIISEYIKQVEIMVRKYPAQWFNYYDFWKA